jgi:hypothetical protein
MLDNPMTQPYLQINLMMSIASKVTTNRCFQIGPKHAEHKGIYREIKLNLDVLDGGSFDNARIKGEQ